MALGPLWRSARTATIHDHGQTPMASFRPADATSIRSASSAAFSPPIGWSTPISRGVTSRALACASTRGRKVLVVMTKLATPCFSSSMLSWKLHDEQAPQSASAWIAARYFKATLAIISEGAG